MACISKLASAIAYDCDSGATGLVSAIIINKADIASYTLANGEEVQGLTLVSGASAYKVDTVKRSTTVSVALKVNDGAPNAYSHTATLTVMTERGRTGYPTMMGALSNGSFVILARHGADARQCAVYGLYYGLSATSAERSSHDNGGWATVTLETPENVIGEDNLSIGTASYDALYTAAVG
ncbi:hypothetical protein BU730P1_00011 [Bacteroides phage BU730P1]|nr:hypothetical protein BU730P1_00011 [Bacteroides phage BU730P1]